MSDWNRFNNVGESQSRKRRGRSLLPLMVLVIVVLAGVIVVLVTMLLQRPESPETVSFAAAPSTTMATVSSNEILRPTIGIATNVNLPTSTALPVQVVTIAATPLPTIPNNPQGALAGDLAAAMLNQVNVLRQQQGAVPLVLNPALITAAQRHSDDMARTGILSHTGSDNSILSNRVTDAGYTFGQVGENILYRWNLDADGAFEQWVTSESHNENMVNPQFREMGLAYAVANDGKVFMTMTLGVDQSGAQPLVAAPTESGFALVPTQVAVSTSAPAGDLLSPSDSQLLSEAAGRMNALEYYKFSYNTEMSVEIAGQSGTMSISGEGLIHALSDGKFDLQTLLTINYSEGGVMQGFRMELVFKDLVLYGRGFDDATNRRTSWIAFDALPIISDFMGVEDINDVLDMAFSNVPNIDDSNLEEILALIHVGDHIINRSLGQQGDYIVFDSNLNMVQFLSSPDFAGFLSGFAAAVPPEVLEEAPFLTDMGLDNPQDVALLLNMMIPMIVPEFDISLQRQVQPNTRYIEQIRLDVGAQMGDMLMQGMPLPDNAAANAVPQIDITAVVVLYDFDIPVTITPPPANEISWVRKMSDLEMLNVQILPIQ